MKILSSLKAAVRFLAAVCRAQIDKNEKSYRAVVEQADDIIYRTDARGCFTFVNPTFVRLLGRSDNEVRRLRYTDVVAPARRKQIGRFYVEQAKKSVPNTYLELPLVAADGTEFWIGQNVQLIFENGTAAGFQAVARDITSRIKIEQALKESEERYRLVTDSASDAIFTIDASSTIIFVNSAAERIFGYAVDKLIGADLSIIIPERLRAAHRAGMQRYLATSERRIPWQAIEVPALRRDGSEFPIEISFGESKSNEQHLFTAVIRDISKRKLVEAALKASEENYRFLAESVPQQVWTALPTGELDYANQRTIEYFGKTAPNQLLGNEWLAVLHPEDVSLCVERWTRSIETGEPYEIEFRLRRAADGEYRWHLAQAAPMRDAEGKIIKWFGTNTDVHERRLADERLRKSEEYLNLFRHANDAIIIFEPENERVLDVNDRACEMYGYEREDFVGRSIKEMSQNVEHGDRQLAKLLDNGTYDGFETVQFRRDGTLMNLLINSSVIEFEGRPAVLSINRDVTARKQAEREIYQSKQMLQLVMDTIPQAIWWKDLDSVYLGANRFLAQLAGLDSPEKIVGLTDYEMPWTRDDADYFRESDRRVIESGVGEFDVIEQQRLSRDKQAWLSKNKVPLRDSDGNIVGVLGTFEDITEQKLKDIALRESEEKFRTLIESMSEGVLQVDADDYIRFVNNRFCEMVGYSSDELLGAQWSQMLLDDEGAQMVREINERRRQGISDRYEIKMRKKTGETIWTFVGGVPVYTNGVMNGSMGVFSDITDRKRAEEQLVYNALHDGLTGLPNRALFLEHLRTAIDRHARRATKTFAVLFLDFDRFKVINDSLGHMVGDKLLVMIARRLEQTLRTGDIVARLGGDEFTILLDDLNDAEDAMTIVERIENDFKLPFDLDGHEVFTSASIGIAFSGVGYAKPEEMLRDADIAMYRAKATGKAKHQIFSQAMHDQANVRLQLETELRQAVEREEFTVYYQPIVELEINRIVGFESLVRWQHPTRGMVSPADFIPVAEETGLITPLGEWVLRESCRQLREWQTENPAHKNLTISVNLSCKQFVQEDLVERVANILRETNLDAGCLRLEITESHVMEDTQAAIAIMRRLRALGIKLSIDDFGTGYSSLSYLHRFPINYLKIDRSFVSRMQANPENGEIVRTIITLAKNLGIDAVAEGIETNDQAARLRNLKCRFGQGYLFSKPVSAAAAGELINAIPFVNQLIDEDILSLETIN